MQEIFGKTLLCKNTEVASHYRKSYNIGCVTIDGDKIAKKGAVRGGYYDHSLSKITLNKAKKIENEKIKQMQDEEKDIEEQIKKLQQVHVNLTTELTKIMNEERQITQVMQVQKLDDSLHSDVIASAGHRRSSVQDRTRAIKN